MNAQTKLETVALRLETERNSLILERGQVEALGAEIAEKIRRDATGETTYSPKARQADREAVSGATLAIAEGERTVGILETQIQELEKAAAAESIPGILEAMKHFPARGAAIRQRADALCAEIAALSEETRGAHAAYERSRAKLSRACEVAGDGSAPVALVDAAGVRLGIQPSVVFERLRAAFLSAGLV